MIGNPTGADLKAARTAAGLTQTQAAEMCHRSQRGWQKMESGERETDPAIYELLLLKTGQHPTLRVLPK